MEETIKLIQEKNKFSIEINGTTIPNIKSYQVKSSVDGIATLNLEIVIPTKDIKVQVGF